MGHLVYIAFVPTDLLILIGTTPLISICPGLTHPRMAGQVIYPVLMNLSRKHHASQSASWLAISQVRNIFITLWFLYVIFGSGLGRDYPPSDVGEWPFVKDPKLNASTSARFPETSYGELMDAVSTFPLVNLPYEYPIYSNTGMGLLGLANVAANKLASATLDDEPQTHKELLKRDIFDPLGMHASFYRMPDDAAVRRHMAIPSTNSEWADIPFGDVLDSAGGQYSSLADLVALMKTLLSPTARGGLIPASVAREWLRPLHTWGSGGQEVGAPWEITTLADAKAYTKGNSFLLVLFLYPAH